MTTARAVVEALHSVIDPEIGVNVVDLGLVYGLDVAGGDVRVTLSMTTPTCPLSEYLVDASQQTIARQVPGVGTVVVEIVTDPPWAPEMMSDAARRQLGWGE